MTPFVWRLLFDGDRACLVPAWFVTTGDATIARTFWCGPRRRLCPPRTRGRPWKTSSSTRTRDATTKEVSLYSGWLWNQSWFYLTSIQHENECGTETAYNCATSDPNKCIYSRTGLWCDKLLVHGCTQCRQAEWGRRRRSNDSSSSTFSTLPTLTSI